MADDVAQIIVAKPRTFSIDLDTSRSVLVKGRIQKGEASALLTEQWKDSHAALAAQPPVKCTNWEVGGDATGVTALARARTMVACRKNILVGMQQCERSKTKRGCSRAGVRTREQRLDGCIRPAGTMVTVVTRQVRHVGRLLTSRSGRVRAPSVHVGGDANAYSLCDDMCSRAIALLAAVVIGASFDAFAGGAPTATPALALELVGKVIASQVAHNVSYIPGPTGVPALREAKVGVLAYSGP
jgi:hypothetical protein